MPHNEITIRKFSWRRGLLKFTVICILLSGGFISAALLTNPALPGDDSFCTVVLARDGTPLRAFADSNGVWRYPVTIDEVSPLYIEAILGYEDRFFRMHPGVNPFSLIRASFQCLATGKIVSGGSTITMQVARLFNPQSRTVSGKIRQILHAVKLEFMLSKDEILTLYLNYAPFGGVIEGVQTASYTYLGKPANMLSHAEAALLAVLPQAPSRLRPDRHPERACLARNKVLARMAKFKIWEKETVNDAKKESVIAQHLKHPVSAPLFARRVRKFIKQGTARVTTIDHHLQNALEERLKELANELPLHTSAAILVVDNADLGVRAYAGSVNFNDSERFGHIDMVQAIRSPGSTLKPFLYGIALDQGLIHSESLLTDAPVSFDGYQPTNFTNGFCGPVSVTEALIRSLNVPAVQVLKQLIPEIFTNRLRHGGLRLYLPDSAKPNLSVILGGAGVQLENLVAAYSALGRKGIAGKLRYFEDEPIVERYLMSEGAAWIIREILENHQRQEMNLRHIDLPLHRQIAWKTGTSYGYRDALAVGVNRHYTVGVWIGRPDGTPVPGHYGAITAAPILFCIFDSLLVEGNTRFGWECPESVSREEICWPLGTSCKETREELCHVKRKAWILNNVVPPTFPDYHEKDLTGQLVKVRINPASGKQVPAGCRVEDTKTSEIARWPISVQPWLPASIKKCSTIPPVDPACGDFSSPHKNNIKLVGLKSGTTLRRPGASDRNPQVTLNVIGTKQSVFWMINGEILNRAPADEVFQYQFNTPGKYDITVLDEEGNYDMINVCVVE